MYIELQVTNTAPPPFPFPHSFAGVLAPIFLLLDLYPILIPPLFQLEQNMTFKCLILNVFLLLLEKCKPCKASQA